ncbi:uncharacterized protein LOC135118465 [Helicoverpa armigera]|uniref:uncharacterized protein LOC135118465 n=1 Tax=Helicoverpa armigera TaxID=29058 RepID=UPI0030827C0C
MPITRSRAASLTRRDDTLEVFPDPSRPTTPTPTAPAYHQDGGGASSPRTDNNNATFSADNVATIIASLQRSQTEAFKELFDSMNRANASTPVALLGQSTLTRCKATFSGRPKESVEAFIDAIEAYSECAQVTDSNIVRGLAYLFKDEAATWWQGIKESHYKHPTQQHARTRHPIPDCQINVSPVVGSSVSTWSQVKENLISAYGDRRPPPRIYLEIFSTPQQQHENTDIFVARVRALLARLPKGDVSESAQIDMTYALLHSRIRKRLRREEIKSFTELLRLARNIEDAYDQKLTTPISDNRVQQNVQPPSTSAHHSHHAPRAPPASSHSTTVRAPTSSVVHARTPTSSDAIPPRRSAPAPPTRDSQRPASVNRQRPVCSYCKRYGHIRDQCRKLVNQGERIQSTINSADSETFYCTDLFSFYCTDFFSCKYLQNVVCSDATTEPSAGRSLRPIFKIKIMNFNGTALIDTAAKRCIAGHSLYTLLLGQGHSFNSSSQNVKLADGIIRTMDVLTTTLEVHLESKVITVPFIVFPDSTNNETLLGIDFITAAGIVIDFDKDIWYFSSDDNIKYTLSYEPTSRRVSCASTDILRDDEGTHLTSAERQALADVLNRHAHVFRAGGGPTPYAEHRIETGDHPPIAVPPYRLNPSKKQLMKADTQQPDVVIGRYHSQDITRYHGNEHSFPLPVIPKRKRGRPTVSIPVQERGRSPELEGECIANHLHSEHTRPVRASRGRIPPRYLDGADIDALG